MFYVSRQTIIARQTKPFFVWWEQTMVCRQQTMVWRQQTMKQPEQSRPYARGSATNINPRKMRTWSDGSYNKPSGKGKKASSTKRQQARIRQRQDAVRLQSFSPFSRHKASQRQPRRPPAANKGRPKRGAGSWQRRKVE